MLFQTHKICSCSFFLRVEEHHLPSGSDAGCSGTKPASSIVIQNRQTVASQGARCMGYAEIAWSAVCSMAPNSQFDDGARPHLHMETPDVSPQAIELSQRCSKQAHSNGPSNGPRNENMEYGCTFGVLSTPSIVFPMSHATA